MLNTIFLLTGFYFCPARYSYDKINHVCENKLNILGPFTDKMVNKCVSGGGGSACKGNYWYKSFGLKIRGKDFCPLGATFLKDIGYCVDSKGIYGPFLQTDVEKCYKVALRQTCESMRWSSDLVQAIGLTKIKVPKTPVQVKLNVPYHFQLNNKYEPYATCGVSSAAMVLNYYNIWVTPDNLYSRFGKKKGQSPKGLADIYKSYGLYAKHSYNATRLDIKNHIDNKRPVVVHGWLTGAGHIFVITGYNDKGWIVNDPNGKWVGCYKCGFQTQTSGKSIVYNYNNLYGSVIGYDKQIWISTASKTPL